MVDDSASKPEQKPHIRKFAVRPVESTARSTRSSKGGQQESTSEAHPDDSVQSPTISSAPSTVRRFKPALIETTKRSRKRGDTLPAILQSDKTDEPSTRHHQISHTHAVPIPPKRTPDRSSSARSIESRFSSENISKRKPRRTSFQIPHLERINSSDDSNVPSLSTTPSAISDEDLQKQISRGREGRDEKFSGLILSLAAHTAEKQLKEQALAAYPNERQSHQVSHFTINRGSSDSDEGHGCDLLSPDHYDDDSVLRDESAAGWSTADMRKHNDLSEEQRRKQNKTERQEKASPDFSPFQNPYGVGALQRKIPTNNQHTTLGGPIHNPQELGMMRSAAAPPMLGCDLTFPLCPSPQQTRIDPTQKPRVRNGELVTSRQHSGLWTPGPSSPSKTRKTSAACLWGGSCTTVQNECHDRTQKVQSGLMTPALLEHSAKVLNSDSTHLLSPPYAPSVRVLSEALSFEADLELEYPDSFCTQVYNYLSFGYPNVARDFDVELSKISKIPVEEIRNNDSITNDEGFLQTPEGIGPSEEDAKENCMRWRALRLYIHEWGRQQSRMAAGGTDNWGRCGRKGSWAG